MPILKDQAQVLRLHEYGNTSLVLVLLCRRLGQVRVLAKGGRRYAKRGFEGGFDFLCRGEIVFYPRLGEGLWIFKEWTERFRPAFPGHSVGLLRTACYLCEITERYTREAAGSDLGPAPGGREGGSWAAGAAEHERLYAQLARAVGRLERGEPPGSVILSYTLRLLDWSGVLPDLGRCCVSGAPFLEGGSRQPALLSEGGLLSREQAEAASGAGGLGAGQRAAQGSSGSLAGGAGAGGLWLSPETLGALALMKEAERPVRLTRAAAGNAARALESWVHWSLESQPRLLGFALEQVRMLGGGPAAGPRAGKGRSSAV